MNNSSLQLTNLRCEYKVNPIGIDALQPRLSWQMVSKERGARQTAYQVLVADSTDGLDATEGHIWDSGKVSSGESIHHPYQGPPLRSGQRCYWKVRVWDTHDQPSEWSTPAFWEMGLLSPFDWKAEWIGPDLKEDKSSPQPCPMLRKAFRVEGPVRSARTYVTSLGLYELELNGRRVDDQVLTPGWTSYDKRLQYQTYDVTELLQEGENAVGATLGDGWYRGNVTQYLPPRGVYIPDSLTLGHWTPRLPDPDSQEFGKKYKAKYKADPGGTAAMAHDGMKTICKVWKEKHNLSFDSFVGVSVPGLTGTIQFNSRGKQDTKTPLLYEFRNGSYHYERF